MALSYTQLDGLTTNASFLGRVREAVAYHAHYLRDMVGATQAQKDWVAQVFIVGRCAQVAANLAWELVQDSKITSAVNADASDVTDANIQTAVDAICEKYT
jgi:hypothetical protein